MSKLCFYSFALMLCLMSCANEKSKEIDIFLDRMELLINQYDKELDKQVLDDAKISEILSEIETLDAKAGEEFGNSASDSQSRRYDELTNRMDRVLEKEERVLERLDSEAENSDD